MRMAKRRKISSPVTILKRVVVDEYQESIPALDRRSRAGESSMVDAIDSPEIKWDVGTSDGGKIQPVERQFQSLVSVYQTVSLGASLYRSHRHLLSSCLSRLPQHQAHYRNT